MNIKLAKFKKYIRSIVAKVGLSIAALALIATNFALIPKVEAAGVVNATWTGYYNDPDFPGGVAEALDHATDPTKEVIHIGTIWNEIVDSLTINGESYNDFLPTTRAELLAHNTDQCLDIYVDVPKSDDYNVAIHTHEITAEELFIGNFLWNNDAARLNDPNVPEEKKDDVVANGTLTFVKAKYDGVTYNSLAELANAGNGFSWNDSTAQHDGEAVLPVGTELTIKLIPDAGYQLVSFGINGGTFEPQENVGEYTFVIRGGNGHLAARFEQVDDEVQADSEAITSGTIELGGDEDSMSTGTAKLEVNDVDLTDDQITDFSDAAGDYTISNYLDISLYNTIYKGSRTDSWDTEVTELDNEATITLKLADDVDGNEVVIVHEKHDGTYEVIPTIYNPETHTITFKTSSFSNYAIASRTVATETAATSTISSPDTGESTNEEGASAQAGGLSPIAIIALVIVVANLILGKIVANVLKKRKAENKIETEE